MEDFELELKQEFLEESTDLLEAAESAFLRLESERDNPDLMNEIFRLAHNLKGTSKAVGFDQLAELTHTAEDLILKLKEGQLEITDEAVTALLDFKDYVVVIVEGLKDDLDATFEINSLQKILKAITEGKSSSKEAVEETIKEAEEEVKKETVVEPLIEAAPPEAEADTETPEISEAALESLRELGLDPNSEAVAVTEVKEQFSEEEKKSILDQVGQAFEETEVKAEALPTQEVKQAVKKEAPKKTAGESDESIRVKLSRIDSLNNVLGELVILQTVISQRRYEFIKDELSNKSIGMMSKLFKEVQEISMSFRMLPLKGTFQKMTRIVRDTSKTLEKKVNLNIVGEETEVDKTVLEKLGDPLVHIIRNAVDHGLETPSDRVAAGKDETGTVELMAFHEGSNLVIQVTDDGKGIDPNIIRKKAIEKGVIRENDQLSDQQVIQLIFHPGFSTKEQVSEVSGRGVGMDVVKTNIENLGGEVKLMSKLGEGSSFKIVLPLTLAIIEGIVIAVNEESFVIPLSQIYEFHRLQPENIETFSGVADLFRLRGEVLPLFSINKKLGKETRKTEDLTVIVVRGLAFPFGVVVDDIVNQQQIVIKKLGEDLQGTKGIMGSAIMSDGMPALILDLFEIFKEDLKQNRNMIRQVSA